MLGRGDVLGRYEIEDMIGIGGMAIVYRAKQLTLNRSVALKLLAAEFTSDDFRERFRREGKLAASLDHPNIVPVYDADEADGRLFIAMRLVEGETLAERVRQSGAIPASKTLSLLGPIASALDAAHDAGLVHRDVKPQNILLSRTDHPYLADFGIAKGDSTATSLTSAGAFVGTVNYASPEQILGYELTGRTDVYALTVVLYECLAGRVPFLRDTDVAVLHAHLHDPPPGLPANGHGPRETVNAVIARGMAKDPADRFRSAGELLDAVELALAGPTRSAPPRPSNGPSAPVTRQRPSLGRAGGLLDAAARTITGLPAEALHTRAAETAPAAGPKLVEPVPATAPPRWRERRRFRRRRALAAVPVAALGVGLTLLLIPHGGTSDPKTTGSGVSDSRVAGKALSAEPDATVAAALRNALSQLAKARGAVGSALASSDLGTRARGAAKVASADRAASTAILKIKAGPRRPKALHDLAAAMATEAGRLDALGSAIHSRDRTAYRNARAGARRAEASMQRSLTALKVAGYGTKSAPLPPLSLNPGIASSLPRAKKVVPSSSGGSTASSGSGSSSRSTTPPSYRSSGGGTTRSTPPKKSGGDTIPGTNGHYSG
jgi:predicted Ser/Thr protein kinase